MKITILEASDHVHDLRSERIPGTQEWIRGGGHSFGAEPYHVLFENVLEFFGDFEIEIRIIRWNFPKSNRKE